MTLGAPSGAPFVLSFRRGRFFCPYIEIVLPFPSQVRYNRNMTQTLDFTVTQTVHLDPSTLSATPQHVGQWMASCGISEWFNYDDEGTFSYSTRKVDGDIEYTIVDIDENKSLTFTGLEFFKKHVELIWLSTITNYRHDWINFAFKSHGADPDEYDANTCDAVLQNMLYGEIVYG